MVVVSSRITDHDGLIDSSVISALNIVWKSEVPFSVKVFSWRAMQDRLPTKDQILRLGLSQSEHISNCVFCGLEVETLTHLLFQCEFSRKIWLPMQTWAGIYFEYEFSMGNISIIIDIK